MSLGLEAEKFGTDEAIADDKKVAEVYAAKGAKIVDLDEKTVDSGGPSRAIRPGRTTLKRQRCRRSC